MVLSQTASHWGAYAVEVEGNDVHGVRPFAGDGDPAPLVAGLPHLLRHPLCIGRPYVREGYWAAAAHRGCSEVRNRSCR